MRVKLISIIFIFLLMMPFLSSLTEEERIRNNKLIESEKIAKPESSGIIGDSYKGKGFVPNPFVVIGLLIAIMFLIYFIVKIRLERERV